MRSRPPSCQGCELLENFLLFSLNNAVSMDVCCHSSCLLLLPGEDVLLVGIAIPAGSRSTPQSALLHPRIRSAFFLVMCELLFFRFLAFAGEFSVNFLSSVFKYFVADWALKDV